MNNFTAKKLLWATREFYAKCAHEFSDTRQAGWPGWAKCARVLDNISRNALEQLKILDIACGNMRFEKWLSLEHPALKFSAVAVDSCAELAQYCAGEEMRERIDFKLFDVGGWLVELCGVQGNGTHGTTGGAQGDSQGDGENERKNAGATFPFLDEANAENLLTTTDAHKFDAAVCFGFMHHVPGASARVQLLWAMLDATKSGGFVIVSFWCFARNEKMLARAQAATSAGLLYLNNVGGETGNLELERGDYLLGFGSAKEAFRYCHSFTNAEIDALLARARATTPFKQVARFSADGRSGNLNEYVILRKL